VRDESGGDRLQETTAGGAELKYKENTYVGGDGGGL